MCITILKKNERKFEWRSIKNLVFLNQRQRIKKKNNAKSKDQWKVKFFQVDARLFFQEKTQTSQQLNMCMTIVKN